MKYVFSTLAGTFLILSGCTSIDARPIPASVKLDKICIEFNSEVNVEDFVPVVQEDFFSHGITSVVYRSDRPKGCQFTMTYSVDRWWDLKPYLADARMTVNKDDAFIGSGHYHLNGHGGLDLGKYAGTHSKIDPVVDEMLRNYPKVDMGKDGKVTGLSSHVTGNLR